MSRQEITGILTQFSRKELLDPRIVKLLFENYDEILKTVLVKQATERESYQKQFALLEAA
jgi:hypothetical protein